MPRYFIEVAYMGTNYSGFQIQQNANSIQSEIQKALEIFFKQPFILTGASRTDAGVHANQNFFHFDTDEILVSEKHLKKAGGPIVSEKAVVSISKGLGNAVYHLNSILPWDITIHNLFYVCPSAHCRYDAVEREYKYFIYQRKNPFLKDRAYYFPYKLNLENLRLAADIIKNQSDFTSFSKRSTQVNNFTCRISNNCWAHEDDILVYTVSANRFLRGMVRALVATTLKLGRGTITEQQFKEIFIARDCSRADFSSPAHGLFLHSVQYPRNVFL